MEAGSQREVVKDMKEGGTYLPMTDWKVAPNSSEATTALVCSASQVSAMSFWAATGGIRTCGSQS